MTTPSSGKKKEILKQAGIYSFSTQLTQAITLVAAVLSRRFLGPAQTGIWATLQILVDYSKYGTMGLLDASAREIPRLQGKGENENAEKIKNLAFSFVLLSSTLIAAAVMGGAFLLRHHFRPEVVYGLYFVAAVIFLQRINNLLVALLRCYKKFHIESVFMIASAVVNAVLVAVLTHAFKIYGFIWSLILSFMFNIAFLLSQNRYDFRWYLDRERLKPLLSYGLPLMSLGILAAFIRTIDKLMIVKMLGFEAVGVYSIALMACSYLSNFSISLAIVLVPHFQERFGQRGDPKDLEPYLFKASKAYALTLPFMISLAWFAAPVGVHWALPKFIEGIPAMKALSLSLFFIAVLQPFHDFLITIKKHVLLFPILGITCATAFGADYAVIRAGWGIQGVALATTASFALNFLLVYAAAGLFLTGLRSWLRQLGHLSAILFYFLTALMAADRLSAQSGLAPLPAALSGLAIYAAACLPLLFLLNREFGLLALIRQKLGRSRSRPAA